VDLEDARSAAPAAPVTPTTALLDYIREHPAEARAEALKAWRAQKRAARSNPNVFCETVLRDEETDELVVQAPHHIAWQELATAHKRLVIWSHVESGKSSQFSVGRVLYELGRNHNLRIAIISSTAGQAEKFLGVIKEYIEHSPELREVFADDPLEPGKLWTQSAVKVRRKSKAKDPSIQAIGIDGALVGARIDLMIFDDILDYDNTRTLHLRNEVWNKIQSSGFMGRLTKNGRLWVVGTAFNDGGGDPGAADALHRFASLWPDRAFKYPVIDEQTGELRWPSRWPQERIDERRGELTPVEFSRQLLCIARSEEDARFKWDWIKRALERGKGRAMAYRLTIIPAGCRVYTGVDLAVQKHSKSDTTVLFTVIIHPNGDREVLEIIGGKFHGPEIVERIIDVHRRFGSIAVVENNAAQDYILQFTRNVSDVPLQSHTTGANKAHPEFGVESIAAEMANGKWIIPNKDGQVHPEVEQWIREMLHYNPAEHVGDRLMACWFAREGSRKTKLRARSFRARFRKR
jgi:hypothetical protein